VAVIVEPDAVVGFAKSKVRSLTITFRHPAVKKDDPACEIRVCVDKDTPYNSVITPISQTYT
jgi:hypothetical protein